jgi:hypothetical protein
VKIMESNGTQSQIDKIEAEKIRIGANAGRYMVTERFWRGVHNTAAETVLLFPPDWEGHKKPLLIQMDENHMPPGISADWREWSVSDQVSHNVSFVSNLTEDPWYGIGEG